MRNPVRLILGAGMLLAASSASAQRYDPAYAFCADLADENGSRMECFYTSMEQCKEASKGMPGSCLKNPFYKPPPPEPTPVAEPAPSPSPAPLKKKKKS
jgi:Protein of unknown function (DUF3551)